MSCGKFVFPSHPSHYLPLPILDVLILALASESQALLGFSPLPSSILISLHLHSVSFSRLFSASTHLCLAPFCPKTASIRDIGAKTRRSTTLKLCQKEVQRETVSAKDEKNHQQLIIAILAQPPQMRFASNALQRTVELDAQQLCRATLMESFQCDLQATNCKRQ
jgi:hypothetical protein